MNTNKLSSDKNLRALSRAELLKYHRQATQNERTASAQLIAALKENIRRELFKEMGYSDQMINHYTARATEGETAVGDFEDAIERLLVAEKEGGTFA